ncbi:MAG: DUF5362 family protein [Balneolaceae bacterium]|nr:DUF5362 family protein [Balneolaceae bacterium]
MEEQKKEMGSSKVNVKNLSVLAGENLVSVVDKMAADMKFYAIFYIIYGGLSCLTIIGAIIGVPMIIYNLKLKDAAEQYRDFAKSKDFFMLNKAFENQRKFFFFNKILIIISIVFIVLYIIFLIIFGASLFMSPEMSDFA